MLYEVLVTLEVDYGMQAYGVQVSVIAERNDETEGKWCDILQDAAVVKYTHLSGARLPDYAHLVDYTVTREGVNVVEVRRPNVAIHWNADEVQGVDTDAFRQAVTEFGNLWLTYNR